MKMWKKMLRDMQNRMKLCRNEVISDKDKAVIEEVMTENVLELMKVKKISSLKNPSQT